MNSFVILVNLKTSYRTGRGLGHPAAGCNADMLIRGEASWFKWDSFERKSKS